MDCVFYAYQISGIIYYLWFKEIEDPDYQVDSHTLYITRGNRVNMYYGD